MLIITSLTCEGGRPERSRSFLRVTQLGSQHWSQRVCLWMGLVLCAHLFVTSLSRCGPLALGCAFTEAPVGLPWEEEPGWRVTSVLLPRSGHLCAELCSRRPGR